MQPPQFLLIQPRRVRGLQAANQMRSFSAEFISAKNTVRGADCARSSSRGSLLRFTPRGQSSDIRLLLLSKRKQCFRLEKEEENERVEFSLLDPKPSLRIEEEKPQAICSFRGSCANRGNGMSAARFDEVRGAEREPFSSRIAVRLDYLPAGTSQVVP